MRMLQHLLRPFLVIFLLDVLTVGFSQRQFVPTSGGGIWEDTLTKRNDSVSDFYDMDRSLLVDVWAKEILRGNQPGNFGLRFTPESDQNVYLLYNYEIIDDKSKAEIGFSMNNFNALTLKYSRSFSIHDLIKE